MADRHTIILFDGICNFCSASMNRLIDLDRRDRFRFASLQSSAGRALLHEHAFPSDFLGSVVVIDQGEPLIRSAAILRVAKRLGWPWKLLCVGWIIPRPLRDWMYNFVATHRYQWFGKRESCRVPTPELRDRFLA